MVERIVDTQPNDGTAASRAVVQVVTPVRPELHKAMRIKAAEEGTTIRMLMMQGLRAIGLPVLQEDEQDRRSARGNRRNKMPDKAASRMDES